ncbi:MAG: putative MFS family arabinose efflux permease [Planctomycetota bacterium]|jgi:predicted MFS family arabinose efflux permease
MNNIAKIILTIATLVYGIGPLVADMNTSHVLHPDWTPHARFHMVWLLTITSAVAIISLWLIWIRSQPIIAAMLGLCVVGGFWIAVATRQIYNGALNDPGGIETKILGFNENAFSLGIVTAFLLIGLVMCDRK